MAVRISYSRKNFSQPKIIFSAEGRNSEISPKISGRIFRQFSAGFFILKPFRSHTIVLNSVYFGIFGKNKINYINRVLYIVSLSISFNFCHKTMVTKKSRRLCHWGQKVKLGKQASFQSKIHGLFLLLFYHMKG